MCAGHGVVEGLSWRWANRPPFGLPAGGLFPEGRATRRDRRAAGSHSVGVLLSRAPSALLTVPTAGQAAFSVLSGFISVSRPPCEPELREGKDFSVPFPAEDRPPPGPVLGSWRTPGEYLPSGSMDVCGSGRREPRCPSGRPLP